MSVAIQPEPSELRHNDSVDTSEFDISKLKSMVIEKWKSDPILWPAKVIPLARVLDREKRAGGRPGGEVGGFFTCLRAVMSKTPPEMEEILAVCGKSKSLE